MTMFEAIATALVHATLVALAQTLALAQPTVPVSAGAAAGQVTVPAGAQAAMPEGAQAALSMAAQAALSLAAQAVTPAGAQAAGSPSRLAPAQPSALARQPLGAWAWPLAPPPPVTRPFERPLTRWSAGHRGVDLAARPGQDVLAPSAGTVSFAGTVAGRGVLVITHASGLRSSFEPVSAVLPVGAAVARGESVATLDAASGHCQTAPSCLHWGVRRGEEYLDPLLLLGPREVVLVPSR